MNGMNNESTVSYYITSFLKWISSGRICPKNRVDFGILVHYVQLQFTIYDSQLQLQFTIQN